METKEIPLELKDTLDKETFEKSRLYQVDKSRFGFFASVYSQIESSVRCNRHCCFSPTEYELIWGSNLGTQLAEIKWMIEIW